MAHSTSHSIPNNRTDGLDAANESTRLLPGDEESSARTPSPSQPATPLPKAQLGALIAVRIVDPIAYQQIFPYINQLLADLRIAQPERVGFYSGLVVRMNYLDMVMSPLMITPRRTNNRKAPTRSRKCFRCISEEGYQVGRCPSASHKLTRCH